MRRGIRRAAVVAVACAVALAAGATAGSLLVISAPIEDPDAIVSLASHEWERLPETAAQAARFPGALVVLTRPEQVNPYNCHDCENRTHRLALAGVDPSRVRVLQLTGPGTHGEAQAARRLVALYGVRRVLVVTSPYHTLRSLATFRTALRPLGVEVGVVPATNTSPAKPAWWWTAPYDRAYVAYEWAATIYYAGRYRAWPGIVFNRTPNQEHER